MSTTRLSCNEFTASRQRDPALPVVYIVDDDTQSRQLLESLIIGAGWEPQAFSCAQEFLAHPRATTPSCVILDTSLPDVDSLALQQTLALDRKETPIIFVSATADVNTAIRAMKAGAAEFFVKPLHHELLLTAVSDAIAWSEAALARAAQRRVLCERFASLTRRELEVMTFVVTGRLNKQIAADLAISEITVKAHRGQLMRKMKARSVPELVKMGARLDLEPALAL